MVRVFTLAGVLLALGGCADNPMLSDHPTPDLASGAAVADAQVTPQGCVVGGVCLLPPISGGWCEPWMELDWDCSDGGGTCMTSVGEPTDPEEAITVQGCPGGDGGGGGRGPGGDGGPGSGGTTPPGGDPGTICPMATTGSCPGEDPPSDGICTAGENGSVCEEEDRPECTRRPDAPGECVTRPPNPTEWDDLGDKVDRMTESSEYCREAKAIVQGMYAAGREGGRIVFWDGRNYEPGSNQKKMVWGKNSSDSRGRIIELDSFLAFDVPSLLAHEALHAYLNSINWQGTTQEQEDWVRAREIECAG